MSNSEKSNESPPFLYVNQQKYTAEEFFTAVFNHENISHAVDLQVILKVMGVAKDEVQSKRY